MKDDGLDLIIIEEWATISDEQINYVVEDHQRLIDLIEKGGGTILPRRMPNKHRANMMINLWYLLRGMDKTHPASTNPNP